MADYIKRSDAIKAMAQYLMDMALIDNPEASDRIEEWEGSIAAPVMSTVKAADVVEVVRCKECKYYKEDVWAEVNNVPLIVAHEMCEFWGDGCKTEENSYCSFGERSGT